MTDDWRLKVDLREPGAADSLAERMAAEVLEHELDTSFPDRVVVSRDGAEVFCYTGTRGQAEQAEKLIRSLASEHGWHADAELKRWHPAAETWEDPDAPVPQDDSERAAERGALMVRERREMQERGYPEFEVRVQCASHREALEFVEKLRAQGLPSVHRWKYVLIAAADEDSASALAARLREAAPAGSTITAEGTLQAVYDVTARNPFAIFGGMAG